MSKKPHIILVEDVTAELTWHLMASASTLRDKKLKRLWGVVGRRMWKVEVGDETAYHGGSARSAVRAYNEAG